jgi:hypothetical protein
MPQLHDESSPRGSGTHYSTIVHSVSVLARTLLPVQIQVTYSNYGVDINRLIDVLRHLIMMVVIHLF